MIAAKPDVFLGGIKSAPSSRLDDGCQTKAPIKNPAGAGFWYFMKFHEVKVWCPDGVKVTAV